MKRSSPYNAAVVGLCWLLIALGCANSRKPRALTIEQRKAIQAALDSKHYPYADELEISDGGWLVATFELDGPVTRSSLEKFATGTLLAIREAMLPFHVVDHYRVTLNGPSPGTGLIQRYGSARFIEGDKVTWEPAR